MRMLHCRTACVIMVLEAYFIKLKYLQEYLVLVYELN